MLTIIQPTIFNRLTPRSKKQAKHDCAQKALDSFVQFRDAFDGVVKGGKGGVAAAIADFTSDQLAFGSLVTTFHDDNNDVAKDLSSHRHKTIAAVAAPGTKRRASTKAASPLDDSDVEMRDKTPVDDG